MAHSLIVWYVCVANNCPIMSHLISMIIVSDVTFVLFARGPFSLSMFEWSRANDACCGVHLWRSFVRQLTSIPWVNIAVDDVPTRVVRCRARLISTPFDIPGIQGLLWTKRVLSAMGSRLIKRVCCVAVTGLEDKQIRKVCHLPQRQNVDPQHNKCRMATTMAKHRDHYSRPGYIIDWWTD